MKKYRKQFTKFFRTVLYCISFIGLALINNSCKDDLGAWQDDNTYTVAGHLYYDCNMEPIQNMTIQLVVDHPNGPSGDDLNMTVETITDSLGYFKFTFKNKKDYPLVIQYKNGFNLKTIMRDIEAKKSINDLELHFSPMTNICVGLNVLNPYTENDTLHITDFRTNNHISIPGPFVTGNIYFAPNFQLFEEYYHGEKRCLSWYLNAYNNFEEQKWFTIDKYCADTVFVQADIK